MARWKTLAFGYLLLIGTLLLVWSCTRACHSAGTHTAGPIRSAAMGTIAIAPATSASVLTRFAIEATAEDHQVSSIGVLKQADSTAVDGYFSDSSPEDDSFDFSVRYCKLPDDLAALATFGSIVGNCESTACYQDFSGLTSSTSFLLVGFRVWLHDEDGDQDLQSLVVMPTGAAVNQVLVAFNGSETLSHGFVYRLQYALVPSARLREVIVEDEEPSAPSGLRFSDALAGSADQRYLGGFSFARVGIDATAHLRSVSVDLGNGSASFHDRDGGEIVRWRVKYYVPR